ncbi:MAG: glycosyltransferase family 39 protein, partial [Candidatus Limnocylindrus sp.]
MRTIILLASIILVATVARVLGIGDQALWWSNGADEVYALRSSLDPLESLIFPLRDNGNMLAFYLIGHLWTQILPSIPPVDEFQLRLLPMVLSILTILVVYSLTKRVASLMLLGKNSQELAALVASLYFSIHPMAVRYAQEFRAYSLQMLAISIATLALIRATSREATPRQSWLGLIIYILFSVIGVYSHMLSALFLVPQLILTIIWLLRTGAVKLAQMIALSGIAIALALVPLAATVISAGHSQIDWVEQISVKRTLSLAGSLIGAPRLVSSWHVYALITLFALIPLMAAVIRSITAKPRSEVTLLIIFAPTVIAILVGVFVSVWITSIWMDRYFAFLLVPIAVVVGLGCSFLVEWLFHWRVRGRSIGKIVGPAVLTFAASFYLVNLGTTFSRADERKFSDAREFRNAVMETNRMCSDPAIRFYYSSNEDNLRSLVKWYGLEPIFQIPMAGRSISMPSSETPRGMITPVCLMFLNINESSQI